MRAYPATPGRWLRTEGKIVTEVPWIFAAPTGANKVTVYWDGVPGATGYRVRWGVQSGVYPNASGVLPAGARRHTVEGLVSEQAYYFVVEAEYNRLWSPPSEEDSAVPHEGAIPWDSGDPYPIMPALRQAVAGTSAVGDLVALAPDGIVYTEYTVENADADFYPDRSLLLIRSFGGLVEIPVHREGQSRTLTNVHSGPYRRVATTIPAQAVSSMFFIPCVAGPRYVPGFGYIYIDILSESDSPWVYFGLTTGRGAVEAGLCFHPAGRGGINYPRWQLTMIPKVRKDKETPSPAYTDSLNLRGHIRADDIFAGGVFVRMELRVFPPERKTKLIKLTLHQYDAILGELVAIRELTASVNIDATDTTASWRKVHAMAQKLLPSSPEYRTSVKL